MSATVAWFTSMALIAALGWWLGAFLGRSPARATSGLVLGVVMLGCWAYLANHQAVAVRVIPIHVLSSIEGVAAVPIFMFIIGIVWSQSRMPRQKRVAAWASLLGAVYFLQGGMWMLQTTPAVGFGDSVERGAVLQSQEYSCVPAACATALNMLRVYTSEAEMAHLTRTRPGTGATTVRALHGLNQRLVGTPFRAELLRVDAEDLHRIEMPALTPLQYERTRRHMVTLMEVTAWGVWIADPIDGSVIMDWATFQSVYTGEVIVFDHLRRGQFVTATPAP